MSEYLDADVLAGLGDALGDADLLRETVDLYLSELPARRSAITDAARDGELEALRFAAHSLASSSALLGGLELSRWCRRLERDETAEDPEGRRGLVAGFDEAFRGTAAALEAWSVAQGSNR